MELVSYIYRLTQNFPTDERFGLVQQLRRAAVSIPSNIAEGAARQGKPEFRHFVAIARGSLSEVDTQLDIAVQLGYLNAETRCVAESLMERIDRMLFKLHESLQR